MTEPKRRMIRVGEDVYAPAEDTYLLLRHLKRGRGRALEIGTGSGIIALELARKGWSVVATDISLSAVRNALENAENFGVKERIEFMVADLIGFLRKGVKIDLLVFNPPYVPDIYSLEEMKDLSWSGGPTGRAIVDRFLDEIKQRDIHVQVVLLVQSTLSDVEKTLRDLKIAGFKTEVIGKEKSFFEEIVLIKALKA
ncbi:MAG: methyltransferase [Nitrososphaeria archaeon]|nr:methyltransferase [Nitrososphaeria archaeon]NIN51873.1 methyltransferase [Nitrososphaeria archaeon]NIQ32421.1 methyltransferase [Nitrososphaeria archaeon]